MQPAQWSYLRLWLQHHSRRFICGLGADLVEANYPRNFENIPSLGIFDEIISDGKKYIHSLGRAF
jgi:hypothetical protein